MILGSIVLSSNSPPNPHLGLERDLTGQHVPGRQNGVWWLKPAEYMEHEQIYIPQRDKRILAYTYSEDPEFMARLTKSLSDLDARFPGLTQSQKYYKVQEELGEKPYLAVLNTEGDHGSWSFLVQDVPLHFYGVWDGTSVQLMWADADIGPELRSVTTPRLWIYRFPVIRNRPVFIRTQALCSKWWGWITADKRGDFFRCFNTLETFLFGLGNRL